MDISCRFDVFFFETYCVGCFLTCAKRREWGNDPLANSQFHHPGNPQQPIHSLRLAPVIWLVVWTIFYFSMYWE